MPVWIDVVAREGAFLLVLALLGSGPAAYLPARFDSGSRIALAPLLGYCVGSALATTSLEFFAVDSVPWLLVPVALASAAFAAWRASLAADPRSWLGHLRLGDVAQVLAICAAVAAPLTYTLAERGSVGPVSYEYTDVDSYVAQESGARTTSTDDAADAWQRALDDGRRFRSLTQYNWAFRADFDQQLDASPLKANVNALLGLGATDTFSPFLIVLLLGGALAAFASIRAFTGTHSWYAALGGALFGGPLFLELYYDSYQAAISGLALILPLAVLAGEALTRRRKADVLLCALVLSGFLTTYPLFTPLIILTVAIVLGWLGVRAKRKGVSLAPAARAIGLRLVVIGLLAVAFGPVAFARDLTYAKLTLEGTVPLPRVAWTLPFEVIPGWLFQTREFWFMPPLDVGGWKQIVLGAVIPACLAGVVALAVVRNRRAGVLLVLAGMCALAAWYSFATQDACSYCAQRNLLPIAPVIAALVALGLHTLHQAGGPFSRVIAVVGAVLVVLVVGQRARIELIRFMDGAYFLDSANREVLDRLPADDAPVQLEGYGASLKAQAEQGLTYFLVDERARGRTSISLGANEFSGLGYLTFNNVLPPGPEFRSDYRYVLTRFGGVRSDRRTIARSGPIALQQRGAGLDVTPIAGLVVSFARVDGSGMPWVRADAPLLLWLTGGDPSAPASVRLELRTDTPATVPPQPGVRARQRGKTLAVCLPTRREGPVRVGSLRVSFTPVPAPRPEGKFPPPTAPQGVALIGMRGVPGDCQAGRR